MTPYEPSKIVVRKGGPNQQAEVRFGDLDITRVADYVSVELSPLSFPRMFARLVGDAIDVETTGTLTLYVPEEIKKVLLAAGWTAPEDESSPKEGR